MISENILECCDTFVVEYFPKTAKVISEYMSSKFRKIIYESHQSKIEWLHKFLEDARKLPGSILSIAEAWPTQTKNMPQDQ